MIAAEVENASRHKVAVVWLALPSGERFPHGFSLRAGSCFRRPAQDFLRRRLKVGDIEAIQDFGGEGHVAPL